MSRTMELTPLELRTITRIVEELGGEVDSYSGRAMYGAECLSAVTDDNVAAFCLALGVHLTQDDPDLAATFTQQETRIDSMGLGVVIYWPSVKMPKETQDDD